MKQKHSFNFMIGLLIGGLVGLLFWYWQKSTSAEDGALALLDKLAETDRRVRMMKAEMGNGVAEPAVLRNIVVPTTAEELPSFLSREEPSSSDDLTQIKGIGTVFNGRLQQAGVNSFAKLKALTAQNLADILQISLSRAENILVEAKSHI